MVGASLLSPIGEMGFAFYDFSLQRISISYCCSGSLLHRGTKRRRFTITWFLFLEVAFSDVALLVDAQ
jgi:hypothetical protein